MIVTTGYELLLIMSWIREADTREKIKNTIAYLLADVEGKTSQKLQKQVTSNWPHFSESYFLLSIKPKYCGIFTNIKSNDLRLEIHRGQMNLKSRMDLR